MKSNIYDLLRDLRKEKGYSLREVSERTGMAHTVIDNLERGRTYYGKYKNEVKPSYLRKLAEVYDVHYIILMVVSGNVDIEDVKPRPEFEKYKKYMRRRKGEGRTK